MLTHVILLTRKIYPPRKPQYMYTILCQFLYCQVYAQYTYLNSDNIIMCHVFKGMYFTIKSVSVFARCVARHNVYAQKQ